jgi:hypothetical protein
MPPDWNAERSRRHSFGKTEAPGSSAVKLNRFEGASAPAADIRDALSEAIRSIVLPRLVAARQARDLGLAHEGSAITGHDISTMAAHILTPDDSVSESMLNLLRLRGATRIDVLAGLLLEVERRVRGLHRTARLGDAEMMLAVGRLQRLACSRALPAHPTPEPGAPTGRVFIAPLPEERASLMAAVLEDAFVGVGWHCRTQAVVDIQAGAFEDADLVALAAPGWASPTSIRATALKLRTTSRLPVMVVAPYSVGRAAAGIAGDADAVACVTREAVRTAQALLKASA